MAATVKAKLGFMSVVEWADSSETCISCIVIMVFQLASLLAVQREWCAISMSTHAGCVTGIKNTPMPCHGYLACDEHITTASQDQQAALLCKLR
jgi:hypothetical protein